MANNTPTPVHFTDSAKASEHARRKARHSHRDWVVYPLRNGAGWVAAAKTAAVVKQAMLEVGTRGRWYMYMASNAWPLKMSWGLGLIQLRNASVGVE